MRARDAAVVLNQWHVLHRRQGSWRDITGNFSTNQSKCQDVDIECSATDESPKGLDSSPALNTFSNKMCQRLLICMFQL